MKTTALLCALALLMSFGRETAVKNPPVFPKLLTPDGDGRNDLFSIGHLEEYPVNELVVFSRWGNKVYESSPYKGDWNGTCTTCRKGQEISTGTYFYTFTDKSTNTAWNGFVDVIF